MKPPALPVLAAACLLFSAAPLSAAPLASWNFNGIANGAAISSVAGTGTAAFTLSQGAGANQPTASTSIVPSPAATVSALNTSARFQASSANHMIGPAVQPALNFGTDAAFTIEAWVYLSSNPATGTQRYIFSTRTSSAGNSGFGLAVTDTGKVSFVTDGGASGFTNLLSTLPLSLNTWHHLAGARTVAGATYLYVDGTLDNQIASGNTYALASDAAPHLGASPHWGSTKWDGYIAEVRISTGALDPAQFLYNPGTTTAYWKFTGANNGAAISSVTGTGTAAFAVSQAASAHRPIVATTALPVPEQTITALSASARMVDADSCTNDYLIGSAVQPALNFGSNTAFTVEAWVYLGSNPATGTQRYIFSTRTSSAGNSGFGLAVTDTGNVSFVTDGGASGFTNLLSTQPLSLNTWHHLAGMRTIAGATYLYLDGALDNQIASGNTYALASDAAPQLGASPHWSSTKWDGYIAEVRVSTGALTPAQFLYVGNVAAWIAEAAPGQTYPKTTFTTAEGPLMRIKLTAQNGTLTAPVVTAKVFDFWGNSAGTVSVAPGPTATQFDLSPSVTTVGWYNLVLSVTDGTTVFSVVRTRGNSRAAETYNYLPFSIVPVPISVTTMPDSPFGVDSAISTSAGLSIPQQQDLIFNTGVRWVRDRFNWATVNPSPGTFNWGSYKTNADALAARGLKVLQCFQTTPSWTHAGGTTKNYAEDLQGAYAFGYAAAQNMTSVKAWEVWNEMDSVSFSLEPPDQLAAMTKAISLGFRAAPNAPMVLSGPFARDPNVGGLSDTLQANGISDYLDASSFHTYHAIDTVLLEILDTHVSVHDTQLGIAGRPLFLSETGLTYARGGIPDPAMAQANQVRYILGAYTAAFSQGIKPVCWFLLRPYFGSNLTQFGLVDSQLAPLPVYTALAVMTQQLKIGEYHDCIAFDGGNSGTADSLAWVFNDGTNEVSVLIGPSASDILTLPTSVSGVTVYNVMGKQETVTTSGTALTVSSKGFPVYMVMPTGQHISSQPALTFPTPATQNPSSIVLRVNYPANHIAMDPYASQPSYDGAHTGWAPFGYGYTPGEVLTFTVDVYNFSGTVASGSLSFSLPAGFSASPSTPSVTVPANGKVTVSFSIATSSVTPGVTDRWTCNGTFNGTVIAPSSALWMPYVAPQPPPTPCP